MKRLSWWMRIVGVFNLLLGLANLVMVLTTPSSYAENLPYSGSNVGQAFADAWLAFVLDLVVVGIFLIWASFRPVNNINVVWLVVWLELGHGILDDLYLIFRGFAAPFYVGFIVVHLVIIVTGVVFARGACRGLGSQGAPSATVPPGA